MIKTQTQLRKSQTVVDWSHIIEGDETSYPVIQALDLEYNFFLIAYVDKKGKRGTTWASPELRIGALRWFDEKDYYLDKAFGWRVYAYAKPEAPEEASK